MQKYDSRSLLTILDKVRCEVNNLQDIIDSYLEDNEISIVLQEELEELRKVFPSYSAFSEVIELVEEEEKKKHEKY